MAKIESIVEDMDSFNLPVKIAARVKDFDYESIDYDKKIAYITRSSIFLLVDLLSLSLSQTPCLQFHA